jgi:hypothetical protein
MLLTEEGATLALPSLAAYVHSGGFGANRHMVARGAGSVLDLPNLQTITGPTAGNSHLYIRALEGARTNLSGLERISVSTGVNTGYAWGVQVLADGAGSVVDLSGMTDFLDNGQVPNSWISQVNGGQVLADALTTAAGLTLAVRDGRTVSFPSLTTYSHGATGFGTQRSLVQIQSPRFS